MKKKILLWVVFLLGFQFTAFCQNDVIGTAIGNLKTLLTDHMKEKAYLQFDRPYSCYVAGETVYFKAYVFMGERHEPSTIGNVLHVDLINPNNAVLRSIALQLVAGTGWGDFALPDTLAKGVYRIRAYTNWMRNDKNPSYFEQSLSVGSVSGVDQSAGNTAQAAKPDIQFFPEGGSLVAEVPSKIAFKAISTVGLGMDVKGVVVDNQNQQVATFNSTHLGMGEFSFIPELDKSYSASVTFANGAKATVPLPAVQQKGITLAVNTADPSKLSITIRANRPYFKDNINKKFELLIYYAGTLKHYSPVLDNSILGLDLPSTAFPTGVVKVTLLDESGSPLNERLSFVQNADQLKLSISGTKPAYAPDENVGLNLLAKDKDGNPVNGSFSVSVVDESKLLVDDDSELTLPSYLLLSSELKGRIEKPNFYFAHVTDETRADLDVLMMTQGYRRFEWKEMEQAGSAGGANTYAAEKQMDISGSLQTKAGDPVPNCTVTLFPQGANAGAPVVQTTDKDGKFRFPDVAVGAGAKFVLKAQASNKKNLVLTIDKLAAGPAVTPGDPLDEKYNAGADILASAQSGNGHSGYSSNTSVVSLAGNRNNSQARTSKANYASSSLAGAGHADHVVLGDQLKNIPELSMGLQGSLPGIRFIGGVPAMGNSLTVSAGGQSFEPMLVVIDGVEMGNNYNIDLINPNTVATVETLTGANASIYGSNGGQGVMVITTRMTVSVDDGPVSKEMSPGIFSISPNGFYKAREFYVPKYTAGQNRPADQRTTIFWKPDLITDSGGNTSFNFNNSDGKGTYRVEIQGADSKGNIGIEVLRYKVQ